MLLQKSSLISLLDKSIFVFILIFLASLTNSIFVNQLGYYGALILILLRISLSGERKFQKTGLEAPFLLFIAAEILSTVFSAEPLNSFNNLLKRILLLPVVYTVAFAAVDIKKIKLFVKVYLGFSVLTIVIYLAKSAEFVIYNLYQIEQSGPSLFQYPITASEILSFTVIFFFSFLINEKVQFKYRLLNIFLLILSLGALMATYKRTGWLGAAAGIVAVIIVKKKWSLLVLIALLIALAVLLDKNVSEVYTLTKVESKLELKDVIKTNGRAYNVMVDTSEMWVSDYENGLVKYSGTAPVDSFSFAAPVTDFIKADDENYLAYLVDTRFIHLRKNENGRMDPINEFTSPGFTASYAVFNDRLYVVDKDSGLTIFTSTDSYRTVIRFPKLKKFNKVKADSNYMMLYSELNGAVIYSLKEFPHLKITAELKPAERIQFAEFLNGTFIFEENNSVKFFGVKSDSLFLRIKTDKLSKIYKAVEAENKFYLLDYTSNLFEIDLKNIDNPGIKKLYTFNFLPASLTVEGNNFYVTKVKRNRLTSIIDLYLPSNYVRLSLWKAGWKIFLDHPIFGVGDIDLAEYYKQYKNYYDKEIQGHLHNNYIHILAALGLFGFLAVGFLLTKVLILDLQIYRRLKEIPFVSSIALGVLGAYVSFLVAGLTEWNFGDHEIITLVWFTVGLNLAARDSVNSSSNVKGHSQ